jgi:hypothetical protein
MASLTQSLEQCKSVHSGFNFHIYADDILLYFTCTEENIGEASKRISEIIDITEKWMQRNSLLLNTLKTELFIIHSRRRTVSDKAVEVCIGDKKLTFCTSGTLRWLGVFFDVHLTMSYQIKQISSTCFGILRMIKRIRNSLNEKSTRLLCNSMVISRLDYCNALLNNTEKSGIQKLQKVMNFAARLIKKTPRLDHITPVLGELRWLPIEKRIVRKIAIMVFKVLQKKRPSYLSDSIAVYKPLRDLRSASSSSVQLVLGTAKGKYGKGSWTTCAPGIWNKLPRETTKCTRLSLFKQKLDKHLYAN